ncbi:MAG TPA: cytochrome c oxidase subunit I, partial [Acidobacteria bacterium]|nr:cytochrome c oxidase subunit I [Acidobacteriota bacterium]
MSVAASDAVRTEVRDSYLDRGHGVLPWLFSLDHKRIAVLYLAGVVLSFLAGSVLAVAFRSQLLYPSSKLISPAVFSRLFTLHGAMMVFLVLLPAIPAALGGFVLPLMLRAKNVALPRLYLAGFHLYLLGATLLLAAVITGAADTGWDFLPPYSLTTGSSVALTVLGALALALSALCTALTLLVTVQTLRPRGMGWSRLPLFAWSLYIQSAVLIVSLPLLCGALLLLLAERLGGFGLLTPAAGGDPALFEQLFWFAAHPAMYVTLLPALGIVAEIVATFSGRAVAGYRVVVGSFLAMGICSFLGWGVHLVIGDQSGAASVITSFLALSVAVPASLVLLNLLATLRGGAIRLRSPMVLALGSLVLATAGAVSALFRTLLPTASVVAGTAFETGSLHFLVLGGTFTAFLAGLHYWWPKLFGRVYRERSALRTAQIA